MQRSTLLHLRFPFSFFLLPVFLFAFSISEQFDWFDFVITGFILHLLLYPASNGFNSFFDRDEQSIGGLKNPPEVTAELYYSSLLLDLIALVIGYILISPTFSIMLLVYGLVSKAYSHPAIRLKKYPIIGWLAIFIFQGYFTFLMAYIGINSVDISQTLQLKVQIPAILSSILLGGSYPMTQIYQHSEDGERGDYTMSRLLGILGTFHFTAFMFILATGGFVYFYLNYFELQYLILFQVMLLPSLIYFVVWYFRVRKDLNQADYSSTMKLNFISSSLLNVLFVVHWFLTIG